MSFFARPHYTSDATDFINNLKAERPELDADQRQGRALLWDKHIDWEQHAQGLKARVAQKPYVYQTNADPH